MSRSLLSSLAFCALVGFAREGSAAPPCPALSGFKGLARLGEIRSSASKPGSNPVQLERAGKKWAGTPCAELRLGDQVLTDASTTVALEFQNGIVVMMPSSSVRIGSIWSYLGEIFSFGRVKIQDGYVSAAAEGTSYVLRTSAKGSELTVLEGHVSATPKGDGAQRRLESGEVITLSAGVAPLLTRIAPEQVLQRLKALKPLTGYGDAELASLEKHFEAPSPKQAPPKPAQPAPEAPPAAPPAEPAPPPEPPARPIRHDLIAAAPSPAPAPSLPPSVPLLPAPSRDTLFLLFEGSGSLQSGGLSLGSASLQAAWAHRFGSSFGFRALAGASAGRYRSPMFDPDSAREEEAGEGTARLPFTGAHAELDAELHMPFGASFAAVAGLGFRVGASHLDDSIDANHVTFGPTAGYRFEYLFAPPLRGVFGFSAMLQRTPVAACPIGCDGPAEPRPANFQLWLGLLLGVGVDL